MIKYLRVRYDSDVYFFKTEYHVKALTEDVTCEEFVELILQYDLLTKSDDVFDAIMQENLKNITEFFRGKKK